MVVTIPDITPMPRGPNGEIVENTYRNVQSGSGTVTTAGTSVQLASSSTQAKILDINNPNTDTGAILYIGGTAVSSTKGIPLFPASTYRLGVTDLSKVWVDASADGAKFSYNYQW